jgi:integrase
MPSVRKRGDGRYTITVYLGTDDNGRQLRHYETFYGTERQAKRYAQDLDARLRRDPAGPRKAAISLGEYLQRWVRELRGSVSERAWETYEWHVRRLVPVVGHLSLYGVTAPDLRAALAGAYPELAPKTVQGIYATLRAAIRRAAADQIIPHDPSAGIRAPRVPRRRRRVLTPAELAAMLDAARPYKYYIVVRILALTGMRLGEVLGLRWSDVDLDAGTITVRRSIDTRRRRPKPEGDEAKTATSVRTIRLDPETVDLLAGLRRARLAGRVTPLHIDDRYVFGPGDRPLGEYSVRRTLNAALARAGLPHIRVHDLRHGAGSILVADGVDLATAAALLGHTPETLLRVYAHSLRSGESLAGRLAARRDCDTDCDRDGGRH